MHILYFIYLDCAGLADPDTVFLADVPTSVTGIDVADKRIGRVVVPLPIVKDFRCGMRDGGVSSK